MALTIILLPLVPVTIALLLHPYAWIRFFDIIETAGLESFDLVTLFYCSVPIVILTALLIHRLVWPSLSRLVYPLCRYKIVTNRKVLASLGSLLFTYAFNLEEVGWKAALGLFGK